MDIENNIFITEPCDNVYIINVNGLELEVYGLKSCESQYNNDFIICEELDSYVYYSESYLNLCADSFHLKICVGGNFINNYNMAIITFKMNKL